MRPAFVPFSGTANKLTDEHVGATTGPEQPPREQLLRHGDRSPPTLVPASPDRFAVDSHDLAPQREPDPARLMQLLPGTFSVRRAKATQSNS